MGKYSLVELGRSGLGGPAGIWGIIRMSAPASTTSFAFILSAIRDLRSRHATSGADGAAEIGPTAALTLTVLKMMAPKAATPMLSSLCMLNI
jgi:hypothetical protein